MTPYIPETNADLKVTISKDVFEVKRFISE
jgi:hypothetical protein